MLLVDDTMHLTATDLVGHLGCRHLTSLETAAATGAASRPHSWDPLLEILWERGARFEQEYCSHLGATGLELVRIDGIRVDDAALAETSEAMRRGVPVILQAALASGRWRGRADVLRRVERPSNLGAWSYEALDTKLARETKAGAILQFCLYSELLAAAQGVRPEHVHVVSPWNDFEHKTYRVADYAAYFRKARRGLEEAIDGGIDNALYPHPVERCDICDWRPTCDARRRADDHLCLVAGISKVQIGELGRNGIATVAGLAEMPLPLRWKPERGAKNSYGRIREQARIQVEGRLAGKLVHEMLPVFPECGLSRLPEPCPGDVFLDLEGDPFIGMGGFEYLFGYAFRNEDGQEAYRADWAFDAEQEKAAFEQLIDFLGERLRSWPGMHVYHFAPYEPAALKRLMGRYATREDEVDRLLRGQVFVDLYAVFRHACRASVETYSIKNLEPLYGYDREAHLQRANHALARMQAYLELGGTAVEEDDRQTVQGYNRDDCVSTWRLRDWLEGRRAGLVDQGTEVPRPAAPSGDPGASVSEWQARIAPVVASLLGGIPADPADRSAAEQGKWLLANMLDWHRRELKAVWWEYFRLADLTAEELLDERAAISGLTFVGNFGGTAKVPIHRYSFPPQETELRGGEKLKSRGGSDFGSVVALSVEERWVDIKKMAKTASEHADAVFSHKVVGTDEQQGSLLRLAEHVLSGGMEGGGCYRAARDLLMRAPPRLGGEPIQVEGEGSAEAAARLAALLGAGVLPIQGPPGTGKTFTGARMILALVKAGRTVGVTANSHKVVRNLLDEVLKAAKADGAVVQCIQKLSEHEDDVPGLTFTKDNSRIFSSIGAPCQVAGGTSWLWAREEAFEAVDVLFVDEAAQMSLANVLSVAQAGKALVLLGDPQQLDQPMKGSHPEGTDVSALHHLLGGQQTITPDRGLFLDTTWRLHPDVCLFTSEMFYEDRLHSRLGLERQRVNSRGSVSGTGLCFLPVPHEGNKSSSPEEAEVVASLVWSILASVPTWIDRDGREQPVGLADVLVIAPYNAQVFELQERLPDARIGTVDKFQGQEAPIVIYSMTTSTYADAPRGMEFLYSLNRLNVATSRAQCICVLVASPGVMEAECRTPRQMQLANAYCRYLELSRSIDEP